MDKVAGALGKTPILARGIAYKCGGIADLGRPGENEGGLQLAAEAA